MPSAMKGNAPIATAVPAHNRPKSSDTRTVPGAIDSQPNSLPKEEVVRKSRALGDPSTLARFEGAS